MQYITQDSVNLVCLIAPQHKKTFTNYHKRIR